MGNFCLSGNRASQSELDRIQSIQFILENLETQRLMKLKEIKEANCCGICFNDPYDMAFVPCGHIVCSKCNIKSSFTSCPFCRTEIEYKQKLFFS